LQITGPDADDKLRRNKSMYRLKIGKYRVLYRETRRYLLIVRVEERTGKTYRGYNPATAGRLVKLTFGR
jgi:mRNA-degrading endonuclease RelE of RelBE toxin-antitoxin system